MSAHGELARIIQDSALTPAEKAAKYAKFKRGYVTQLDSVKEAFGKVANSTLKTNIERVLDTVMDKGRDVSAGSLAASEAALTVLKLRAADEKELFTGTMARHPALKEAFSLMQHAEGSMTGIAASMREETRLALVAIQQNEADAPNLRARQQQEADSIGALQNLVDDVRSHHRTRNRRREMEDFLQTGMTTQKPVTAPARARFRRNMAKI